MSARARGKATAIRAAHIAARVLCHGADLARALGSLKHLTRQYRSRSAAAHGFQSLLHRRVAELRITPRQSRRGMRGRFYARRFHFVEQFARARLRLCN